MTTRTDGSPRFTINYRRTVLLCVFAVLVNIYYLAHVGWLQFLMSRDDSIAAYEAVWPKGSPGVIVLPCTYMSLLVAFIALLRLRRELKNALACGEKIPPSAVQIIRVLLVIIGLLLANSLNPISTARYLSGTAILATITALGLFATVRRYRITVGAILAGILLVFPLSDAFRVSIEGNFRSVNPVNSLVSADYDSFAQIMNGYLIGEREGIVPGKQFSAVLLFWLRRAIWPNKPIDTGVYIANQRGYSFNNLSAPLWIEFYLNGGWVLVVVGMFALGFALHRWDSRLEAQFNLTGMPGLIETIMPFYMLILLRGSLLQASGFLFFIIVFSMFVRQRKHDRGTAGAQSMSEQKDAASEGRLGAAHVPA